MGNDQYQFLPEKLVKTFEAVHKCALVSWVASENSFAEFVSLLNNVFPYETHDFSMYMFNRENYLANKLRYIEDIKDLKPYDALILWTDPEDILRFFKLENKIKLTFDPSIRRFQCISAKRAKQSTHIPAQVHSESKKDSMNISEILNLPKNDQNAAVVKSFLLETAALNALLKELEAKIKQCVNLATVAQNVVSESTQKKTLYIEDPDNIRYHSSHP
ncbi:unnamed protein product [Phytophthora fragariaefolia]|uniref:Unnamed protein product n=1 Tax=Phytophthora fragariaefolia TaxID=1490495 RepID=A0A9W6Y1Z2_9STRA|nr:unnamed protein product [Phytophthora fragariaefolia]